MLKKILFVLVYAALMLSISSSTVLAGNGGPPDVVNPGDGEECVGYWFAWMKNGNDIRQVRIKGTLSYVYNPYSGFWTSSCHYFVDFDKPNMGTIDDVCGFAEEVWPDLTDCTNGTFYWSGFSCALFDMLTTDTQATVSADGHGIVTCKFFP